MFTQANVNSGFTAPGIVGGTWLLGNTHLLEDAYTIPGDMPIPPFDGIASGNGHVRITLISPVVEIEISLVGNDEITIPLGSTFTDPGVVITRNGEIITGTVTTTGTVNTSIAGTYMITYSFTSIETGGTYTVTRTVIVIDAITNFGFTGSVQTFTVPETGVYRLQVWGAQRRKW